MHFNVHDFLTKYIFLGTRRRSLLRRYAATEIMIMQYKFEFIGSKSKRMRESFYDNINSKFK
jgi:hypothetical protein